MTFDEVIAHYGSQEKTGKALGLSQASVSEWHKAGVPLLRQYQIEVLTAGKLTVDISPKQAQSLDAPAATGVGATPTTNAGREPNPVVLPPSGGDYRGGSPSDLHGPRKPRRGPRSRGESPRQQGINPKTIVSKLLSKPSLESLDGQELKQAVGALKQTKIGPKLPPYTHEELNPTKPLESPPTPPSDPGAAARLAMMDAGPTAQADLTGQQQDTKPPTTRRLPDWKQSERGILDRAKQVGVKPIAGETWGKLIERVVDAQRSKPLP